MIKSAALLTALLVTLSTAFAEKQTLKAHKPPAVDRLSPVARLEPARTLELGIALPLRNRETLTNVLQELYDPASTNYHQYLSANEFAQQFGPTEKDYEAMKAFAKVNGLTVTGVHPNRTLLEVSASVADIEKLFHVALRVYQHPKEARTFYAPDAEPFIDAPVKVLSVSGLDDFIMPRPMNLVTNFDNLSDATAYATGSGPRGDFIGKDFRVAYAPGVSLDGAGQSVGLFELDGYNRADIRAYENLAGLPDIPVTNVLVGTATGISGGNNVEVALDIEVVISMAPGVSNVIVYEGRATAPNGVLNRMATDNLAKQLSCSWGFGSPIDPAREQILMQYAAQGQSFFQASGDLGAWTGNITPPSSDPWATVVGGTSLTTTSPGGAWSAETVWSSSSGGFDTNYTIPVWQQGVASATNQGSAQYRNIPDVAALADIIIFLVANNGQHAKVGGTSASAPLWAAFNALVNEQAAAAGRPPVGFLNPALYSVGKGPAYSVAFHDITSGNNTNSSSPNRFFATPGYDLCTGWGTPTGSNLINVLLDPPDALKISPASALILTGPASGPFTPASQNFSLTNVASGLLGWSLVSTSAWLNASTLSGTLSSGGAATTVTFTLKAAASNLLAGSYTDTVLFNNLNSGSIQPRPFTLAVVTPPMITSQPVGQTVFEGMSTTFSVNTSSNAFVSYQWLYDNGIFLTNVADGPNISGSKASTLGIGNVSSANVGAYSVVVSNAAGMAVSSNAFLAIVPWRPVITVQPSNETAFPEQTVQLSVTAVGSQPLSYRWQQNGAYLVDSTNVAGSAAATLTINRLSPTNGGSYSVVVSNSSGSVTSSLANVSLVPLAANGVAMTTLYSFGGGADGANPNGLVDGTNGLFYGTTRNGGTSGYGTVFQLPSNGVPATLFSFSGSNNGARPLAPLLRASDGNFYGSTYQGGTNDYGSLFRITPAGALTMLRSLDYPDGILPYGPPIQGTDGNFYGTGYEGGSGGFGTIFQFLPNGVLNPLCTFTGAVDGAYVNCGVVQGADGALYGTTYRGGASSVGACFRVTTNGSLSTFFSLSSANGSLPIAGLTPGSDGNFYGVTTAGGGTNGAIFKVSPSGLYTKLFSFAGGTNGSFPMAALLQALDGNFYGTTTYGGSYGLGTLFRIAPDGSFATLAQFAGINGANPIAPMIQSADGNIYGTTQNGGLNNRGVIFRLNIAGAAPQFTAQPADQSVFAGANVLFNVAVFGSQPMFFRWHKNGNNLVDSGNISGSSSRVLSLTNASTNDTGIYSLFVTNSFGSDTSVGAFLQVTSSPPIIVQQPTNQTLPPGASAVFAASAIGNGPLSYQWQKNGANLANAGNISGADQNALVITNVIEPSSGTYSLVVGNGLGSATSSPAVLSVIPVSVAGTRLTTLHAFATDTGGNTPNGLVAATNGLLYGTTAYGGPSITGIINGTIFSLPPNGPLSYIASFAGTNGSRPYAGLIQGADGNFYGTASAGGDFGYGVVFKMSPDGPLSTLHSFTGNYDGAAPITVLAQGADQSLYGVSSGVAGGPAPYGVTFRVLTNGTFSTLYAFTNGPDGAYPDQGLLYANDGNLYGLTSYGALAGGNIFRMTPAGMLNNFYTFTNGTDGSTPEGPLIEGSDGNLYGVTMHNKIQGFPFYGTIFKITTNGVLSTLYAFNFTDGSYPYAGLLEASDGNFYGTTYSDAKGNGTVFRITPGGSFANLLSLDGFDTGAHPQAPLVEGPDGSIYGTTTTGGPGGGGTVFKLSVTSAPQILTQPASQTAIAGTRAGFNVTVFGAPLLSYYWQRSGTNLIDGGSLSGVHSRILSFNNLTSADSGSYSVIVSNALGYVASSNAVLTILAPPALQSIARSNASILLAWSAMPGQKYQLQFKSTLTAPNWTDLGTSVTATGATLNASDPIGGNTQRFYRVILLP
jgi:uncharacterized repeat protein (TIGR03803 family)